MTIIDMIGINKNTNTLSSSQILQKGKLNGDYKTNFSGTFQNILDKTAKPIGAAANSATNSSPKGNIDKTSKLYEKSLELESYFVKIMLSSMRNTISKSELYGNKNSYAQKMYEDMVYDELATTMTKNAGFGLADQIYLSLI
ncbi:MAG: flagellar biosynthesis protein FlgJ [Treponema sp.]|nr:flagellar biosynthesis protein FlgJ [Treponema sp.]